MSPIRLATAVAGRIAALPSVSVPLGLGLATLLVSLLAGQAPGFVGFLGLTGVLIGLGTAFTSAIWSYGRLAGEIQTGLRRKADAAHAKYLSDLESRLARDGDSRTVRYLAALASIHDRMRNGILMDVQLQSPLLPEIKDCVAGLYESCLRSLERTLLLWHAAREMSTPEAKAKVTAEREGLLADVEQSIERLKVSLDHLQTAAIRQDRGQDLESIREELDGDLEVAKRVEMRMDELEDQLAVGRRVQARLSERT